MGAIHVLAKLFRSKKVFQKKKYFHLREEINAKHAQDIKRLKKLKHQNLQLETFKELLSDKAIFDKYSEEELIAIYDQINV